MTKRSCCALISRAQNSSSRAFAPALFLSKQQSSMSPWPLPSSSRASMRSPLPDDVRLVLSCAEDVSSPQSWFSTMAAVKSARFRWCGTRPRIECHDVCCRFLRTSQRDARDVLPCSPKETGNLRHQLLGCLLASLGGARSLVASREGPIRRPVQVTALRCRVQRVPQEAPKTTQPKKACVTLFDPETRGVCFRVAEIYSDDSSVFQACFIRAPGNQAKTCSGAVLLF